MGMQDLNQQDRFATKENGEIWPAATYGTAPFSNNLITDGQRHSLVTFKRRFKYQAGSGGLPR